MPNYTFYDKNEPDVDIGTFSMTIAEMEAICAEHPELDTRPALVFIGDIVRQGLKKPSDGFRDILRTYKKKHKGGKNSDYSRGINTF